MQKRMRIQQKSLNRRKASLLRLHFDQFNPNIGLTKIITNCFNILAILYFHINDA